jgi:molybdopterin-guanine dinucleotide biosynthesis protein A
VTRFGDVGFDAIVLAGGSARRLGGADKAELRIGGVRLLDRVLDAAAEAERIVAVGPTRPTTRPVTWTRESPPGGGPVAALAAGLAETASEIVVVLAVDLPGITVDTIRSVVSAVDDDGALLVDDSGHDQTLAAAYRRDALVARLDAFGEVAGVALRDVVAGMSLQRVPAAAAARDLDTWDDVAAARRDLGS